MSITFKAIHGRWDVTWFRDQNSSYLVDIHLSFYSTDGQIEEGYASVLQWFQTLWLRAQRLIYTGLECMIFYLQYSQRQRLKFKVKSKDFFISNGKS